MKKKSLNKLLALGMTIVMAVGSLTGCSDSKSSASKPAKDTEKQSADAGNTDTGTEDSKKDSGDVPTLIWWTVGGTPADDFEEAIAKISDYSEEIGRASCRERV